jgi:hypothetical protein
MVSPAEKERLDPVMENLLRDDPGTLAAWRSAHRVERYSGGKRSEPAPPPETPSTHTNTVAAVQT